MFSLRWQCTQRLLTAAARVHWLDVGRCPLADTAFFCSMYQGCLKMKDLPRRFGFQIVISEMMPGTICLVHM